MTAAVIALCVLAVLIAIGIAVVLIFWDWPGDDPLNEADVADDYIAQSATVATTGASPYSARISDMPEPTGY